MPIGAREPKPIETMNCLQRKKDESVDELISRYIAILV